MMQIEVESPDRATRRLEPVTCGIPWPRGVLRDLTQLRLFDEDGQAIRLQARALDRWPDDSVRWSLLDWQAVVENRAAFRVEVVTVGSPSEVDSPTIHIKQEGRSLTIDTGAACLVIRSGGAFPFDSVTVAGQPVIDAERTRFAAESEDGESFHPRLDKVEVVESGPLRVVTRASGSLGLGVGKPWCHLSAYLHFFAGLGVVRFDLTLHNPRHASHPGNFWSLGEKGSIYFRDAALTLALPQDAGPTHIQFSSERSASFQSCDGRFQLYQDSSGGENWRSTVHVNRHNLVPNSFRGYRIRYGKLEEAGLRATPIVTLKGGGRWLGVAMEYFWQNFPKALEATLDSITLRLFPKQYADVHELQGGEQKNPHILAIVRSGSRDGRAVGLVPCAGPCPRVPILVLFDWCLGSFDFQFRRSA